jgi:hypothetical protein
MDKRKQNTRIDIRMVLFLSAKTLFPAKHRFLRHGLKSVVALKGRVYIKYSYGLVLNTLLWMHCKLGVYPMVYAAFYT